jgi:ribose transport system substrate-binding protein
MNFLFIFFVLIFVSMSSLFSGSVFSKMLSENINAEIAVLYWSMNIPGQVAMAKGLEQELLKINKQAGINHQPQIVLKKFVAGDGESGITRQIQQMYDAIKRNPKVIIVQPTDNAALAAPLRLANKKNIPVVTYDQYISGGKLAAFVTSNNHQAGYLNGEYIASLFPKDKKIKLILVEYPLVSSTVERLNGFLDALRDQHQQYQILKTYQAVEPIAGSKAGRAIVEDFPEKASVDVIFTVNDGGGLNVVNELAKAGRDEIILATVDGDPDSVKNIELGRLTRIDTAQFCGALGANALKVAYQLVLNKSVPALIRVPVYPITKETLSNYPGWAGEIPPSFKKTWPSKSQFWNNKLLTNP